MSKKFLSTTVLLIIAFTLGWQGALYLEQKQPSLKVNTPNFISAQKDNPAKSNQTYNSSQNLQLFWQVWEMLEKDYIDPTVIDNEKRIYGAIKGMVNSLKDPYTV